MVRPYILEVNLAPALNTKEPGVNQVGVAKMMPYSMTPGALFYTVLIDVLC